MMMGLVTFYIIRNRKSIAHVTTDDSQDNPGSELMDGAKDFMCKVDNIIKANSFTSIKVTELSEQLGIPERSLLRYFKNFTGLKPKQYIMQKQLETAKSLLDQDHSVSKVSAQLGFSSAAYFSRVFEQHYNMSPCDYQKQKTFNALNKPKVA